MKRHMRNGRCAGLMKMDVLASTVLLAVVMSVSASMFHHINLVWKDVRYHRIATSELANQLDVLTRVDPGEIEALVEELKPSEICSDALPESSLSAKVVKDEIGDRIDLEIQWRSGHGTRADRRPNRARLSGWLMGGTPK